MILKVIVSQKAQDLSDVFNRQEAQVTGSAELMGLLGRNDTLGEAQALHLG